MLRYSTLTPSIVRIWQRRQCQEGRHCNTRTGPEIPGTWPGGANILRLAGSRGAHISFCGTASLRTCDVVRRTIVAGPRPDVTPHCDGEGEPAGCRIESGACDARTPLDQNSRNPRMGRPGEACGKCLAGWWALRLIVGVYAPLSISANPPGARRGLRWATGRSDRWWRSRDRRPSWMSVAGSAGPAVAQLDDPAPGRGAGDQFE